MPVQAIAPAAAGEPGEARLTWDHPLATVAARICGQQHPDTCPARLGDVACGPCWFTALLNDFRFALDHDLPLEIEVDPLYVDEIAVERAMRGEELELTDLERAEVRRRLADVRTRRNRSYAFTCSRAAAARRDAVRQLNGWS
jgi:hypothetical protein